MEPCPLCPPVKKKSKWYYEDADCYVCDCETCHVPMIVLWKHTAKPTQAQMAHLRTVLESLGLWDQDKYDDRMRKIPDHYHAHIRKKPKE